MPRDVLVGVTEARDRFKDLLDDIGDEDIVILRRNRPIAVISHPDRIERLISRIEDLEDEIALLEHRLNPDEGTPHEEVRREFETERETIAS